MEHYWNHQEVQDGAWIKVVDTESHLMKMENEPRKCCQNELLSFVLIQS